MLHAEFKDCSPRNLPSCPTVAEYLDSYFGYKYEFRWWCALILLSFTMVFRISAMLVLKLISHESR
jgi:hypothetical protein